MVAKIVKNRLIPYFNRANSVIFGLYSRENSYRKRHDLD